MIKTALLIVGILIAFAGPVRAGQPPAFFEALYDVPVMPGLLEIPEMSMVFDKPSGRIAQSVAEADAIPAREIELFYSQSLPQLGWTRKSSGAYERENETLQIHVDETGEARIVRFLLEPR